MRVRLFVAWSMLATTFAGAAQRRPLDPPDAIFVNGKIVTVDERFSTRQAFAVRGDRFVAVGTNADIRALSVPTTMGGVTSTPEALERSREAVAKANAGDVVFTSALPVPPDAPGATVQDLDR